MQNEGAANDPVTAADVASASDNINQIKEILFGGDRRAIELRLDDLENRLRERERALRQDMDAAVQTLRTEATDQANNLLAAVAAEREARTRLAKELSEHIEQVRQALDERLNRLDADLNNDLQLTRSALEQQLHDLAERIAEEQAEIARLGTESDQRLQEEKVDAKTLSQLFDALAAQVRGAPIADPTT